MILTDCLERTAASIHNNHAIVRGARSDPEARSPCRSSRAMGASGFALLHAWSRAKRVPEIREDRGCPSKTRTASVSELRIDPSLTLKRQNGIGKSFIRKNNTFAFGYIGRTWTYFSDSVALSISIRLRSAATCKQSFVPVDKNRLDAASLLIWIKYDPRSNDERAGEFKLRNASFKSGSHAGERE